MDPSEFNPQNFAVAASTLAESVAQQQQQLINSIINTASALHNALIDAHARIAELEAAAAAKPKRAPKAE